MEVRKVIKIKAGLTIMEMIGGKYKEKVEWHSIGNQELGQAVLIATINAGTQMHIIDKKPAYAWLLNKLIEIHGIQWFDLIETVKYAGYGIKLIHLKQKKL